MSCPTCGSATSEGAVQCPACGGQLAPTPPPQSSWDAPVGDPWGAPAAGGAGQGGAAQGGAGGETWGPPGGGFAGGAAQGGAGGGPWGAPGGGFAGGDPPGWGGPGGQPPGWGPSGGGQYYQPYPTSGSSNQGQASQGQLAGWWQRVGATVLDGIIIGIPAEIINVSVGRAGYYVFLLLASLIYVSAMLSQRGQTLGMMAVGTRCVQEATGANLTPGAAVGRWAVGEILDITIVGGILDSLWPLWDAKNQTLHDKAVSSLVVRTR
jgi:uncharacterized RDD family membrane protein YckC